MVETIDVHLDPHMPESVVKIGSTRDTVEVIVDESGSSKILKIRDQLEPPIKALLFLF